ncbi:MAG: 3',5'-cyclic-nucleotide phosphodiesterase [Gammaproteobacteria bacterium]|nr:3',5'-cyclic-nucleotide phosphodiesterase [Gammaproteobacteria bacterium]
MRVRVLGCSGGIGRGLRTTSILVDRDILIDAGTGVGDLSLDDLSQIRHVFITHSHLDHIVSLPMLIDNIFEQLLDDPLRVYANAETIAALQEYIFNDVIWPDFTCLPDAENPVIRFVEIDAGDSVDIGDRSLRAIGVEHAVPTLGFCVANGEKVFAFSGDTTTNRTLWPVLNSYERLDVLVVEVSFPDRLAQLARVSGHYTPSTFAADLEKLDHEPAIWVTAMKPGEEEAILDEVGEILPDRAISQLQTGTVFEL